MARNSTRSSLWILHRWIGIGLVVLLIPIGLSGAFLVFDDDIDTLLHPARYRTSGATLLAASDYLTQANAALGPGLEASAVRFPESAGRPVTVQARASGGPLRLVTVYLDPPTARVLDVVDFRSSLIGIIHRFHENLTVPEYSGRAVVGWAGVGMLILSLSGIVLWWPRNGPAARGLRWRRSPATSANLHHLFGFWISVPLAVVSFTGIYLAFPPQARSVMSSVTPMTPQAPRPGFGPLLRTPKLTPDAALAAALAAEPQARPVALFLPAAPRESAGASTSPSWRIQLHKSDGDAVTLLVDDRSGTVTRAADPLAGDRAAQWIRWIHEGSHSGAVWRALVVLTGIFPTVLGVTGVIMWLSGRRARRRLAATAYEGALNPEAAE